jgi:hypothetical protein
MKHADLHHAAAVKLTQWPGRQSSGMTEIKAEPSTILKW